MRKNAIAIGKRYIEGCYNFIMAAGELYVTDSDINAIYLAGEIDVHNSAVHKLRGAGEVKANHVSWGNVKVAGNISLHGICKGDVIVVIGDLSAEFLECRILRNGPANKKKARGGIPVQTANQKADAVNAAAHYDYSNKGLQ